MQIALNQVHKLYVGVGVDVGTGYTAGLWNMIASDKMSKWYTKKQFIEISFDFEFIWLF